MTQDTKPTITDICPVSSLPIMQKRGWTNLPVSPTFSISFKTIGPRILLVIPNGHVTTIDFDKIILYRNMVLQEWLDHQSPIIQISDYSALIGFPHHSFRASIKDYFQSNTKDILGIILFNASWKIRTLMKMGVSKNLLPYPMFYRSNYQQAIEYAQHLLNTVGNPYNNLTLDKFTTQDSWKYQTPDFLVEYKIFKRTVLYSRYSGILQKEHLPGILQIIKQIHHQGTLEPSYYRVTDFSTLSEDPWVGHWNFLKTLRRIYQEHRLPRVIFALKSSPVINAALKISPAKLGIPIFLVNQLETAFAAIRELEYRDLNELPDILNQLESPTSNPYQPYMDEILDYIGAFTWETSGKQINEYPESHPFKPVFDAIGLLKMDMDTLLMERAKTLLQLKENEERYRNLFQHSGDAILLLDKNGLIDFNDITIDIFKIPNRDFFVGKSPWEFSPPTQSDGSDSKEKAQHMIAIAKEVGINRFEWMHRRMDGEDFPAEVILSEVEMGGKAIIQGVVRDITARKKAEKDIEKSRQEALFANNAKSRFLANMSHEIRTPLNGILGMTELLLMDRLTEEQRDRLRDIKFSGQSLMDVISEILDFSKIEAGNMELDLTEFKLSEMCRRVLRMLSIKANEKRLEMFNDIDPDIPDCLIGDPGRLRQILINLMGNAVKFTLTGEIVLAIKKISESPEQVRLEFSVSDTGMGIAEDKISQLFDEFSQVDNSTTRQYGGTGLGLTIAQNFVQSMGGSIHIKSTLGRGSRFFFEIDLKKQRESDPLPGKIEHEAFYNKNLHTLVVAENNTHVGILKKVLEHWNMSVIAVTDCDQAFDYLSATADTRPPDLIIIDFNMPQVQGFAAVERITEFFVDPLPKPKLVLLSFETIRGSRRELTQIGVDRVMVKPVTREDLKRVMAQLWEPPTPSHRYSSLGSNSSINTGKLNVLLAEDNPINRKFVERILTLKNWQVLIACNGREAVQIFQENHVDVVLMDIQMPDMDGYEATMRIRELEAGTGKRVPIIAITAHALPDYREKSFSAGMDHYLTKPINPEKLTQLIQLCTAKTLPWETG